MVMALRAITSTEDIRLIEVRHKRLSVTPSARAVKNRIIPAHKDDA
jgi:hypothetical protein